MKGRLKWIHLVIGLGLIAVLAMVAPALGGPSLKKLVKKEVAKQIAKATGPAGPAGANGTNGANGTDGTARAYGRVAADGTLTRSKNATITHTGATGKYCIALASGIDASQTGLSATADFNGNATNFGSNVQEVVEWVSNAPDCSAGQLEVITGDRVAGTSMNIIDQPFFFVVP